MNDFTKEELYDLESTILNCRLYMGIDTWDKDLLLKIQGMIENYCDHIWTDGSGNNIFCGLCHIHGGKR